MSDKLISLKFFQLASKMQHLRLEVLYHGVAFFTRGILLQVLCACAGKNYWPLAQPVMQTPCSRTSNMELNVHTFCRRWVAPSLLLVTLRRFRRPTRVQQASFAQALAFQRAPYVLHSCRRAWDDLHNGTNSGKRKTLPLCRLPRRYNRLLVVSEQRRHVVHVKWVLARGACANVSFLFT